MFDLHKGFLMIEQYVRVGPINRLLSVTLYLRLRWLAVQVSSLEYRELLLAYAVTLILTLRVTPRYFIVTFMVQIYPKA